MKNANCETHCFSMVLKYKLLKNSIKFLWDFSFGDCTGNMPICTLNIQNTENSKEQPYQLKFLLHFHWHTEQRKILATSNVLIKISNL